MSARARCGGGADVDRRCVGCAASASVVVGGGAGRGDVCVAGAEGGGADPVAVPVVGAGVVGRCAGRAVCAVVAVDALVGPVGGEDRRGGSGGGAGAGGCGGDGAVRGHGAVQRVRVEDGDREGYGR